MSTLSLPRIAAELDHCDGAWYAALSTTQTAADEQLVIWMPEPYIPDSMAGLYRWATDAEVGTAHVTLDAAALAEVLFCSQVVTAAELDTAELLAAIDGTLAVYRCHLDRCAARHATEAGDYPEDTARRYAWCVLCASRLLGVSV